MFAGSASTGGVVSTTATENVPLVALPCVSVAVHVTGVAPTGNTAPDAGTHTGAIAPSTPSVAVAA